MPEVNTISACIVGVQRTIKNSKDHLRAKTLTRRATLILLTNRARADAKVASPPSMDARRNFPEDRRFYLDVVDAIDASC